MGMFVYLVTNLIDGKMYVGKTEKSISERWREHRHKAKHHGVQWNYYLYRAIRKYGSKNFAVECLATATSPEELNLLEKLWILVLDTTAPKGYNLTSGGDGVRGTPEIREKQRRKAIGRPTSALQKQIASETFKNKPKSSNQRAKMAAAWDDTRRKDQSEIAKAVNATENVKLHDYECPDCKTRFVQITRTSYAGHRRWCLNYRDV